MRNSHEPSDIDEVTVEKLTMFVKYLAFIEGLLNAELPEKVKIKNSATYKLILSKKGKKDFSKKVKIYLKIEKVLVNWLIENMLPKYKGRILNGKLLLVPEFDEKGNVVKLYLGSERFVLDIIIDSFKRFIATLICQNEAEPQAA